MIRLLDTNVCIQLWQRKNLKVRSRFEQFSPNEVALCSVVKAELLFGAQRSQNREANLSLLGKLFAPLSSYEFDDSAAAHYAKIRSDLSQSGQIIGANDLLIAAIALSNELTLITHNTSEFARIEGLLVEDWES